MRMKQNLVEFVSLTDQAHLSRQQMWNRYTPVVHRRQQSRVRGKRNFRCSRALFGEQVYVLDRHIPDGEHAVVAGDGLLALYWPDRATFEGGQEDPDEGAIAAALLRGVDAAGLDEEDSTLARDYLDAALPLFACSVVPWIVFQVLVKSAKPILVKTFATKPRHETSWRLQLLEIREGADRQAGQMPDEWQVFPVADAGYVDVSDYINMKSA